MNHMVVILIIGLAIIVGCNEKAPSSSTGRAPNIAAEWQSGRSLYQIMTSGTDVKAVFVRVSPEAEALGFKKGDLSFEGVRKENFIQGEQIIRYPSSNPCYKEGRRVPFMAMIAADGQRIVVDWYNLSVSTETCQDVGRNLGVTLLARGGT